MRLADDAKRLAIFAYYDRDGAVDGYVPYLLRAVRRFCARQVVVVNGALRDEGRRALAACADEVIERANEGFDITAYKEGFLSQDMSQFDEVLFYNQTIFGPVRPLDEMFGAMAARDVDFWGLTRHKGAKAASWNDQIPIPPHVQSFFFAVRGEMLHAPAFRAYWEQLPPIRGYWEAVEKHEIRFTKHFSDQGYAWDVYVDTADLEIYNDYPLMGMPVTLLKERGCPFCKRKNFITARHTYSTVPQGRAGAALYEYLRSETEYPERLIFENLLRTEPLADVVQALGLCRMTDSAPQASAPTAALVCVTSKALAPLLCRAADALPDFVYCEMAYASEALQSAFDPLVRRAHTACVEGKRPAAVLMERLARYQKEFSYLLFLNDDLAPLLREFADATSVLRAVEALEPARCIGVLSREPALGMLVPVPSTHQETVTMAVNLRANSETLRAAGVTAPFGDTGLASRGGMFFARTEALGAAPLADALFDGLYPAWEYLPMLLAQQRGWLTAYAARTQHVQDVWFDETEMMRDIESLWMTPNKSRYDQILFRMKAILDFYHERRYQMTLEQAFHADLTFKQKAWICLQILLKPETFEKLHRRFGHAGPPAAPPHDDLD
ncbi:MAG TPA: rhamnan synthesis F family protein [Candidatus Ruthenibacterium merdigallinarum]|nr:rhamnan synthesis F family protein [Candidatus Ruthenibacterium merdigallinarum]